MVAPSSKHTDEKTESPEKRLDEMIRGGSKDVRTELTHNTACAAAELTTEVTLTPPPAAAVGKRKLSPASALLGNRPAHRCESQAHVGIIIYAVGHP